MDSPLIPGWFKSSWRFPQPDPKAEESSVPHSKAESWDPGEWSVLCPLTWKKLLENRADIQISGDERWEEGLGCIQVPVSLK